MERALVIQLAKLGDFIQSTSFLAGLRQVRPEAEICLLGREPSALEAARLSPLVDTVASSPEALAGQRFTAVYNLNSHPEAAGLGPKLKYDQYYGPILIEGELRFPPAQMFLMALMRLGRRLGRFNLVDVWASLVPEAEASSTFWPGSGKVKKDRGHGPALIGLQLSCRNHLRRWPVENFVALGRELAALGHSFTFVLLGSPEEKALAKKFRALWGRNDLIDLVGGTSLSGLAEALEGLDLLVSADTGVMHLAAALKRPVLGLFFGPAWGPETGPYGVNHLIYQSLAPCAPCLESCSCRQRLCRELPRPDIAAAAVGRLLAGQEGADPWPAVLHDLPPGHRLWQTEAGLFGQDLRPVDPCLLTEEEALALLLTEAGRQLLRPGYQPDAAELKKLFQSYHWPPDPPILRKADLDQIAATGLTGGSFEAGRFRATVENLASNLGLEFASK